MQSVAPNPYDVVPYASHPIRHSVPALLATIAALHELPVPAIATARVLELGCAAGGNIIPLAYNYPAAQFVGIDYSAAQIDEGCGLIGSLGLSNIELRHASIMEINASWGEFDFIICHGVFSWVSREVQDKILAVAAQLLTDNGIAYVSYNTYPGWNLRGIIRDVMQYHAMRFDNPCERVAEARRILDVVAKHTLSPPDSAYGRLLQSEAETMRKNSNHYIYHEHLEEHCEPFHFHEFIRRARENRLDYLGEASFAAIAPGSFGTAAQKALSSLARDRVELEQFADYFSNRTFRKTLLHRAGRPMSFDLPSACLWPMNIASGLRPETQSVDLAAADSVTFTNRAGASLIVALPLLKAALIELSVHWPAAIPFETLLPAAASRLSIAATDFQRILLSRAILSVITSSESIEVSLEPAQFTVSSGELPTASALARQQAAASETVTNRRHESVDLSPIQRRVIQTLDGSCDTAEVARVTDIPPVDVAECVAQLARAALILA